MTQLMPPPNQQEIVQALHRRDAQALGYLFRCPAQLSNYSTSSTNDMPLPSSSQSVIVHEQEWGGVLQLFFHVYKCAEAVSKILVAPTVTASLAVPCISLYLTLVFKGSIVQAYEYQSKLHTSFNQVFGSSVGNWLVPALHTICRDTHKIAVLADKAGEQTQHHSKLENAASLLQESFSRTYNDRKELIPQAPFNEEGSKKIGVLAIVNELFKIYFRLNTLRLCKNLVKPVEVRKLHEPQYTTMGQCVTYKFFVGRLNLFEDQYSEAESNLEFAFKYAHKDALRNKKRILNYLVPVKIYRGRFPSTARKSCLPTSCSVNRFSVTSFT